MVTSSNNVHILKASVKCPSPALKMAVFTITFGFQHTFKKMLKQVIFTKLPMILINKRCRRPDIS
jgi:hypothetical protein